MDGESIMEREWTKKWESDMISPYCMPCAGSDCVKRLATRRVTASASEQGKATGKYVDSIALSWDECEVS